MSERKISEKSLENLRKSNQESNLLTREAIETALLQLLEKKELAKISISELVKRAGVSRAAFYRQERSQGYSACPGLSLGKNLCASHARVSRKILWEIERCQLLPAFFLEFCHRIRFAKMDQGWNEGSC